MMCRGLFITFVSCNHQGFSSSISLFVLLFLVKIILLLTSLHLPSYILVLIIFLSFKRFFSNVGESNTVKLTFYQAVKL